MGDLMYSDWRYFILCGDDNLDDISSSGIRDYRLSLWPVSRIHGLIWTTRVNIQCDLPVNCILLANNRWRCQ